MGSLGDFPELRLNIQLIHALNQATDIVAQHFAQSLVDLRFLALTSQSVAELRLDHTEGRFNV
jgi:hypothetical protein